MSVDYQGLLYGPIYSVLGVTAIITTTSSIAITVTARNLTSPASFSGYGVEFQSFRPAAIVRMSELASIAFEDFGTELVGGEIEMAGQSWSIKSFEYVPSPNSITDGELRLLLKDDLNV